MPRGNDPDAGRELLEKYSQSGNAEQLIQASTAALNADLRAAMKIEVDEEATAKLTDAAAAKLAGVEARNVLDAKVRGNYTVVVYEDERGTQKVAIPKGGSREPLPEHLQRHADLGREVREAREERDEAVEAATAKADAAAGERVAKAGQAARSG